MKAMISLSLLVATLAFGGTSLAADKGSATPNTLVTERIEVNGEVEQPLSLNVDDLRKFPVQEIGELQVICQSGADKGKLQNLKGVYLKDILARAKVRAVAHNDVKKMIVVATASDDYMAVFSLQELTNSPIGNGVIVFYEQDGKPLADDEGRIALVSSLDTRTGPRHVKWLKRIDVRKVGP